MEGVKKKRKEKRIHQKKKIEINYEQDDCISKT